MTDFWKGFEKRAGGKVSEFLKRMNLKGHSKKGLQNTAAGKSL